MDITKEVPDKPLPPGFPGPLHFLKAAAGEKTAAAITGKEAAARVSVMEAIYTVKKHEWVKPE